MVAFARARAKSIFSKLQFKGITPRKIQTHESSKNEVQSLKIENSSNDFFEALKKGGIWLS